MLAMRKIEMQLEKGIFGLVHFLEDFYELFTMRVT